MPVPYLQSWTGGSVPPAGYRRRNAQYRVLVSALFQDQLRACGGLDLWKCAGTGSMERACIFWNRARLDAWATLRELIEHLDAETTLDGGTQFLLPIPHKPQE